MQNKDLSQLGDNSVNIASKHGYNALRLKSPSVNADIEYDKMQFIETSPKSSKANNNQSVAVKSDASYVRKMNNSQPYYTKNKGDEINAFTPVNNALNVTDKIDDLMMLHDPEKVNLEKENQKMKNDQSKLESLIKFYKTKYL